MAPTCFIYVTNKNKIARCVPRGQLVFLQSSQALNILHVHISRFYLQVVVVVVVVVNYINHHRSGFPTVCDEGKSLSWNILDLRPYYMTRAGLLTVREWTLYLPLVTT